jgi:very-short-patch-repair endonuclease
MTLRARTVRARILRRKPTDAERHLWNALRNACPDRKFRRQHPIGRRIVDIACPACKLAIELDGGQHQSNRKSDDLRSVELAQSGYRVIRFWNGDVLQNVDGVMQAILRALEFAPPHPDPLGALGAEREKKPNHQ